MRDTRRFIEHRLQNLNTLWEGEPRIAREEIAKHVGKITLRPMLRTYVATGVWDWLGGHDLRLLWWCRGPDLYIAVPGRNSRSRSQPDQVLPVVFG
jgi:hypothetical protein